MSGHMSLASCVKIHLLQSEYFLCCEERGPEKKAGVYSCGFFHSPRCLHQLVFCKPGVLTLSVNRKCIRTWQWEVPAVDFQGRECVVKAAWGWSAVAWSLQYVARLHLPHALSIPHTFLISALPCILPRSFYDVMPPLWIFWAMSSPRSHVRLSRIVPRIIWAGLDGLCVWIVARACQNSPGMEADLS